MKISIGLIVVLLSVGTFSQAQEKTAKDFPKTEETKKFIEKIAGAWKLERIMVDQNDKNAKAEDKKEKSGGQNEGSGGSESIDHSSYTMQLVEFDPNGRYKINNSTTAVDSGSYRLNEQHGILYLESDANDLKATEWSIAYDNEKLTLTGRGEKPNNRYRYVYAKVKEKLSTN